MTDTDYIHISIEKIREINRDVFILIGAGIQNGDDVYQVISEGADASGSSSAVACASDPQALVNEMLAAARAAWDDRH